MIKLICFVADRFRLEVKFIVEMWYIVSTCVVLLAFHAYHVTGKTVILKASSCATLFSRSVEDPDYRTTSWIPSQDGRRRDCSICNAQDEAPSWLVTQPIPAADSKRIRVSVTMFKSKCYSCLNQGIKVYILYKALAVDQSKAFSMLKSLPLVANISNAKENTEKVHVFHFEPKTRHFSIVFLSAGSCTLIKDITVSYFVCDKNISSLANLPRTVAPASGSKRVNVSCSEKSVNPDGKEGYGLCSSEGIWKFISPCGCEKGHALSVKGKCVGESCGKKLYDPTRQDCCCGRIQRKIPKYQCCGLRYYNTRTTKCCNEKRAILVPVAENCA